MASADLTPPPLQGSAGGTASLLKRPRMEKEAAVTAAPDLSSLWSNMAVLPRRSAAHSLPTLPPGPAVGSCPSAKSIQTVHPKISGVSEPRGRASTCHGRVLSGAACSRTASIQPGAARFAYCHIHARTWARFESQDPASTPPQTPQKPRRPRQSPRLAAAVPGSRQSPRLATLERKRKDENRDASTRLPPTVPKMAAHTKNDSCMESPNGKAYCSKKSPNGKASPIKKSPSGKMSSSKKTPNGKMSNGMTSPTARVTASKLAAAQALAARAKPLSIQRQRPSPSPIMVQGGTSKRGTAGLQSTIAALRLLPGSSQP